MISLELSLMISICNILKDKKQDLEICIPICYDKKIIYKMMDYFSNVYEIQLDGNSNKRDFAGYIIFNEKKLWKK